MKLGFKDDNSCYSMLFVGPSGIGKTCLAKLFSEKLFNNIIRLDMSEYSEAHTVSKLIGTPAGYVGYNDNKNILEQVKDNPFSILILDEIEKAHINVVNLFFQILEEGNIKDSKGDIIYFNNCMIIMTSNIGYNNKSIGFNDSNKNHINLKEIFSVFFINRIDNIFNFNFLTIEDIEKIIKCKLDKIKSKYKDKGIILKISPRVIHSIAEISNYKEYGARRIEKIIKNNMEPLIINEILDNKKIVNIKNIEKEKVIN